AFRALLFSTSPETNAAMTTACESTGIRAEACSDIFGAIEKAKTRAVSCVIVDWADQPEAGFLLKRARESAPNRNTVAIAIVDHEPEAADMRDHRLDFLIYRPISAEEADAVLAKASEQMQAPSADSVTESSGAGDNASSDVQNAPSGDSDGPEQGQQDSPEGSPEADAAQDNDNFDGEIASDEEQPRKRNYAAGLRKACAAVLVLTAAFCLWNSREVIQYLSRTREGRFRVLRESVAALFYMNQTGAIPVGSAGNDAQQDAYYSRGPANSNAQTPALGVVATESTVTEARFTLPKAPDFPLPVPVFEHQEAAPVRVERAAIPESMRDSPPIERPVVVTVNAAQMMPPSAPQPLPAVQQFSEPVAVSEQAARAMLVHSVDPVYPTEGLAQKLHGAVVLQAVVGRDGSVEDLKIVR